MTKNKSGNQYIQIGDNCSKKPLKVSLTIEIAQYN